MNERRGWWWDEGESNADVDGHRTAHQGMTTRPMSDDLERLGGGDVLAAVVVQTTSDTCGAVQETVE